MRLLLAGPWQGEFGWELMRWQAGVRCLSFNGNYDKVVVFIQKGHELLYQDFAQDIRYCKRGLNTDGWKNDHHSPVFSQKVIDLIGNQYPDWDIDIFNPNQHNTLDNEHQLFIKYGEPNKADTYDILMHPRNTGKTKSARRNWSAKNWQEVVRYFRRMNLRIASIGIPEQSMHLSNTDNLLGISIERLSSVLASSRLIIGPSSGPMHLASLCGCPQLVWTDKKKWASLHNNTNRWRYETYWNPFKTPVTVLDDCNWQPQVTSVIYNVKKLLLDIK